MGKGGVTRWPSADYSSNQNRNADYSSNQNRKLVSLQPSLLAQGNMGMRTLHSLLDMYPSEERGRPVTFISAEEQMTKKPTHGKFSNYGN